VVDDNSPDGTGKIVEDYISSIKKIAENTIDVIHRKAKNGLSSAQLEALSKLEGQTFNFAWQLGDSLAEISPEWIVLGGGLKNKLHDRKIKQKLAYLYRNFQRSKI
jgi:glycosyltransferase involved in cell wall biosynthesis